MAYMETCKFAVGDKLILAEHKLLDETDETSRQMTQNMYQYLGAVTRVINISSGSVVHGYKKSNRLYYATVEVDNGHNWWRLRDMLPGGDAQVGSYVDLAQYIKPKKPKIETGCYVELLEDPWSFGAYDNLVGKTVEVTGTAQGNFTFIHEGVTYAWPSKCAKRVTTPKLKIPKPTPPPSKPLPGYAEYVKKYNVM